jgi:hypothetical protein
MLYDCTRCYSISQLRDFRERAIAESRAVLNRGKRVAVSGVRFEYMQQYELIETSRFWSKEFSAVNLRAHLLGLKVASLSFTKVKLADKLESALKEGSLPHIAALFKRAADLGCFEEKEPLLSFVTDMAKNLITIQTHDGHKDGKRFSTSTKLLFETLWKFGGPLSHNFLSENLVGPSLNTSKVLYQKESFRYVGRIDESVGPYLLSVFSEKKAELGIVGLIPFEASEDETKCISLATWNRSNDEIEGFCGDKSIDAKLHKCSFNVFVTAASYESILEAFQKLHLAEMARLIVCNPLIKGFPRLVHAMLPTCNRFDASQVQDQWDQIHAIHDKYLSASIGPLISHASEGDARRRKLMVDGCEGGTNGLNQPGFTFKARLGRNGWLVLYCQDPPHGGKKMRNPLLSASRRLCWGVCLATRNHLRLVMTHFPKDQHGLCKTDIDVRDVQNFPAVQRLAFSKVRTCLNSVQASFTSVSGERIQEDVRGTSAYLQVLWAFLVIFYGRSSLWERIRLASFVVHMLYMGGNFVRHQGHGLNLKENWLTRECVTDMLISCHFAVNLIRLFRDKFPHLPVALDRTGSDCVEDQFSLMGQETRNMRNWTFEEGLERTRSIGRTEQVKVSKDAPRFAASRRRKNIWKEGNPEVGEPNLADYDSVTEPKCDEAWLSGLALARELAISLEMKPVLLRCKKWDEPWPASLFEGIDLTADLAGEAGDIISMSDDIISLSIAASESDARESIILEDPAAELDTEPLSDSSSTSVMASIFDVSAIRSGMLAIEHVLSADESQTNQPSARNKVPCTVEVPNKGLVYKMRLISELNSSPSSLSLDRLKRVQARRAQDGSKAVELDGLSVGLSDVVALHFEEGNVVSWYLGKVQKMFKVGRNNQKIDYHLDVSLEAPRDESVFFVCKFFKEIGTSSTRFKYGGYEGMESDSVSMGSVISIIDLPYSNEESCFVLRDADKLVLETFLLEERNRRAPRTSRARASYTQTETLLAQQSLQARDTQNGGPAVVSATSRYGRATARLVV